MEFEIDYKVRLFQDNTWEVYSIESTTDGEEYEQSHFQGSLTDCEAWIRLTKGGLAEELFQFLLKLKEDGVDLSDISFWYESHYPENQRWEELKEFKYIEEYKELELS